MQTRGQDHMSMEPLSQDHEQTRLTGEKVGEYREWYVTYSDSLPQTNNKLWNARGNGWFYMSKHTTEIAWTLRTGRKIVNMDTTHERYVYSYLVINTINRQ